MMDPAAFKNVAAPGRECGSCTLCCKVFEVPVIEKPEGKWCRHCSPGRGCAIHATRPEHCRAFFCYWMTQPGLGPEWKPDRAKFVLTVDPASHYLFVQLDPGQPGAWRRDPYFGQIRDWAKSALAERRHVVVWLNRSATVVLPEREVALGPVGPGDRIVSRRNPDGEVEVELRRAAAA